MRSKRTAFLREEALLGRNKIKRTPVPREWTMANEPYSLPERKAMCLKKVLDEMPIFIGEQELIVGTRTIFTPAKGNEDGHDRFKFYLSARIPYINDEDLELFGADESYFNKTHYTPDFGILLKKGVKRIVQEVTEKLQEEGLDEVQVNFLKSILICYQGVENLFLRYASYAQELADKEIDKKQKEEYLTIAKNCRYISQKPPETFVQAVQLLWLGHLVSIIESFSAINYGRLDVILADFVKDETDEEIQQLLECLLMKMYDQVDLDDSHLNKYSAQLIVTLGGVNQEGENAVGRVSMLFLEAIDNVRFPDPEINIRVHTKNPPEFLKRAAQLSVTGCNFVSYYNDDRFIESLIKAGVKPEYARDYGFDLCQDMNIPGRSDYYKSAQVRLAELLMDFLLEKDDFPTFDEFYNGYKKAYQKELDFQITEFNEEHERILQYRDGDREVYFKELKEKKFHPNWKRRSLMSPLAYLSTLYHGCVESAFDMTLESYPDKNKGAFIGSATEAVNSIAAIKKVAYEEKHATLKEVVSACKNNYQGEGEELLRNRLWNCPKWGNDDDYVDNIAKDFLEFTLAEILKYKTVSGGQHLSGIHQPKSVMWGERLMATPDGRYAHTPIAVTMTPTNGTMKKGPTAALKSSSKLNPDLIQWNYCMMINYFTSAFDRNNGPEVFCTLLKGHFADGGMQHQPNVLDVEELKAAQETPELYKDLTVRLWGVSAHFVDLPEKFQNEIIERFS